jgi:hypothetical protein
MNRERTIIHEWSLTTEHVTSDRAYESDTTDADRIVGAALVLAGEIRKLREALVPPSLSQLAEQRDLVQREAARQESNREKIRAAYDAGLTPVEITGATGLHETVVRGHIARLRQERAKSAGLVNLVSSAKGS